MREKRERVRITHAPIHSAVDFYRRLLTQPSIVVLLCNDRAHILLLESIVNVPCEQITMGANEEIFGLGLQDSLASNTSLFCTLRTNKNVNIYVP